MSPACSVRRVTLRLPRFARSYSPSVPSYHTISNVDDRSDFLGSFLRSYKPSQNSIDHFYSKSWTREILADPAYEVVPFFSRYFVETTGESRFFARTVKTQGLVPHVVSLRRRVLATPDPSPMLSEHLATQDPAVTPECPDLLTLVHLGADLEAHPGIVQGGFQASVFDEVMYQLVLLHRHNTCPPGPRDIHYTLKMTTSYHAPLPVQSDILVRVWLSGRQGRKWQVRGDVINEDGNTVTTAESLWLTAK